MSDIELTIGAETFELPQPMSCETDVAMAFDIIELDNGMFDSYDNLTQYDKRTCRCSFLLNNTQQAALNRFLFDIPQASLTLTLTSGCGFYPFGADKGDDGVFTVSIVFDGTPKIGTVPFRYFQTDIILTNVGSYPSYSLPSEIDEGSFVIGDVDGLLMPQKMFNPDVNYRFSITHTENSTPLLVDNGIYGRYASTSFNQNCNQTKAAALLHYLVNTVRNGGILLIPDSYYYLFGADYNASGYEYAFLNSNKITVKQISYDLFEIKIGLRRQ